MTPPYGKRGGKGWVEAAPSFNDELGTKLLGQTRQWSILDGISKDAKNGQGLSYLYLPLTSPHLPPCTHPDFQVRSNCPVVIMGFKWKETRF